MSCKEENKVCVLPINGYKIYDIDEDAMYVSKSKESLLENILMYGDIEEVYGISVDELFEEVREESAREAKHEQAIESAKTMLADGLPYETIARYAKLPIEEVKALDTKKPA